MRHIIISPEDLFVEPCRNKSTIINIINSSHPDRINKTGFWLFAEFLSKDPAYFEFGPDSPWNPTYLIYMDEDDNVIAMHAFRLKDTHIDNYAHLMGLQVLSEYSGNHLSEHIMKHTMKFITEKYPDIDGFTLQCHEPSLVNLYRRYGFKQVPGENLMVYTLPGHKTPVRRTNEGWGDNNLIDRHYISNFIRRFRETYGMLSLTLSDVAYALSKMGIEPDIEHKYLDSDILRIFRDPSLYSRMGHILKKTRQPFVEPARHNTVSIYSRKPDRFEENRTRVENYRESVRRENERRYREEMDRASQELLDADN